MKTSRPNGQGRRPSEAPVYSWRDLASIVIRDGRVRELVPAYDRVHASTSFERFQSVREQYPEADKAALIARWRESMDADLADYADRFVAYLRALNADLIAGAYYLTRDDVTGVRADRNGPERYPTRVGLRPSTDDARAIIAAFAGEVAAIRKAGGDPLAGFHGLVATVLKWLGFQHPITKTLASRKWDKTFRHRTRFRVFLRQEIADYIKRAPRLEQEGRPPSLAPRVHSAPQNNAPCASPPYSHEGRPVDGAEATEENVIPLLPHAKVTWLCGYRIEQHHDGRTCVFDRTGRIC